MRRFGFYLILLMLGLNVVIFYPVGDHADMANLLYLTADKQAAIPPAIVKVAEAAEEPADALPETTEELSAADGKFVDPCGSEAHYLSYGYAMRDGIFHNGYDISSRGRNIPIYAAGAGTVNRSYLSLSYGYTVVIDHGNKTYSLYGHMAQKPLVSVGDKITAGTQIGLMGDTGYSDGIHLHFTIYSPKSTENINQELTKVYGHTVDPSTMIKFNFSK